MVFFQQCWWVVEVDVMAFFEEFHEHCQFEKSLNASFSSLLFAWRNWFGKHLSTAWNMVPTCLMWLVWKERNTSIFEDKERPLDLLKAFLFGTLFQWTCIWVLRIVFQFLNSYTLIA